MCSATSHAPRYRHSECRRSHERDPQGTRQNATSCSLDASSCGKRSPLARAAVASKSTCAERHTLPASYAQRRQSSPPRPLHFIQFCPLATAQKKSDTRLRHCKPPISHPLHTNTATRSRERPRCAHVSALPSTIVLLTRLRSSWLRRRHWTQPGTFRHAVGFSWSTSAPARWCSVMKATILQFRTATCWILENIAHGSRWSLQGCKQ